MVSTRKNVFAVAQVSKSKILENHMRDVWSRLRVIETPSFHKVIRWVFILLHIVPLFPISTFLGKKASQVTYSPWSIFSLANTFLLIFGAAELTVVIIYCIQLGFGFTQFSAILFFVVTLLAAVCLRVLARDWPRVIMKWEKLEKTFLKYPYKPPKHNLSVVLTVTAGAMFVFMVSEHVLYYIKAVQETRINILHCNLSGKVDLLEHHFNRERGWFFLYFRFQSWMAPFLEWENFSYAMCWSSIDVLIILISITLSCRFDQFNDRVRSLVEQSTSEELWYEIRTHYGYLEDLVELVDKQLSNIVLISCSNNMYFICYFIFKAFTPRTFLLERLHFWTQMTLIFGRTLGVLFAASMINDSSKQSLKYLRKLHHKDYNLEVERLVDQIEMHTVALTGRNLFRMTRKMILSFVGTIVTFEIALLDEVTKEGTRPYLCNRTL